MPRTPYREQLIANNVAANGTCTVNKDGPPAGYVDNLTFSFPTAPVGATFQLTVSNMVCAIWSGPTPWGPLMISNNESISIYCTGLSPGVVYNGIMAGSRSSVDDIPASAPAFGPTTVAIVNLGTSSVSTSPAFSLGTGGDGNVTLTAGATLTRPMNYASLVVNAGVLLASGGYPIFCTGTVTVNGQIDNSGGNGSTTASAAPGATGTLGGGGLPGGGGPPGGTGTVNGGSPPAAVVEGGKGGNVGSGDTGGSTTGWPPSLTAANLSATFSGGGGGANAGGAGYYGAGAGAGVVLICCAALAGSGTITANGGNASTSVPDYCGGGGGGVVLVCTFSAGSFTGSLSASGGTGYGSTSYNGFPGVATIFVAGSSVNSLFST